MVKNKQSNLVENLNFYDQIKQQTYLCKNILESKNFKINDFGEISLNN